jgi:hypothetical protein
MSTNEDLMQKKEITNCAFALQSYNFASEVASIANNLIGAGVLSLSGGIALYSDDPNTVVSAGVWVVLLGVIFGYFWWVCA